MRKVDRRKLRLMVLRANYHLKTMGVPFKKYSSRRLQLHAGFCAANLKNLLQLRTNYDILQVGSTSIAHLTLLSLPAARPGACQL